VVEDNQQQTTIAVYSLLLKTIFEFNGHRRDGRVYHCYNGDVAFSWESGNSSSCKIETLKQIVPKFVIMDYVDEGTPIPNLVLKISPETSGQNVTFCNFIFF